jgi:hypothetical protein
MIALDLDGTLLNSRKLISAEDAEALQAAVNRGVEIVPVTGRNFTFALPAVRRLPFPVTVIASNGAVIRSTAGETHSRSLLPGPAAAAVLRATREFRRYAVVMYDEPGAGQVRIETPSDGAAEPAASAQDRALGLQGIAYSGWVERNRSLIRFVDCLEETLQGDPLEVLFAGPLDMIRAVEARLEGFWPEAAADGNGREQLSAPPRGFRLLRTEYPEQGFSMLDVIRGDCSKGRALEHWSRTRGIPPAEVMAIGDNYNDLEMLRFAGLPVVMGNACEPMKQNGWHVTLDCDSSGVAHAVRKYVLG